jgi:ribulose 1,5-bisphosphate carboxylase large subunit-like protein
MAVAEGDLTVANLWENINSLGRDLLVEPTSGILNFPGGAAKGAAAFRLLAEELLPEMTPEIAHSTIQNLSNKNRDLREGLKYFEYTPPRIG